MATFLEELKSVNLKKSDKPMKDYSSPKLAGFLSKEEIKEYQNAVLDVNIELWHELLNDITFPSQFCPIKMEEAETFIQIFERLFRNLDADKIAEIDLWRSLTVEEKTTVDQLAERLDVVLKQVLKNSHSGFAFVKTSSRSPKDAPMAQGHFRDLYQTFLNKLFNEKRDEENEQIICLLQAAFDALKVLTSKQVLQLMLTSERIYQDMLLALEIRERYHENFVIREFVHIDVDMEFRAFVYNFEMTAVSQYNYLIFSQKLVDNQTDIERKLKTFYSEEVKPRLKDKFPPHFIVDFAVCKDKLWVIEVNPFLVSTDSALFSWEHERDLLEDKDRFKFRIVEKAKPGAKTMLPNSIKTLMSTIKH